MNDGYCVKHEKALSQIRDDEIRELVNELTREVKRVTKDAPHCLRSVISRVVRNNLKA